MDTYTSDEMQESLQNIINKAVDESHPCKVTSPNGNVVVLSEETYQNILVTLELLSTPGLMENVDQQLIEEELSEALV